MNRPRIIPCPVEPSANNTPVRNNAHRTRPFEGQNRNVIRVSHKSAAIKRKTNTATQLFMTWFEIPIPRVVQGGPGQLGHSSRAVFCAQRKVAHIRTLIRLLKPSPCHRFVTIGNGFVPSGRISKFSPIKQNRSKPTTGENAHDVCRRHGHRKTIGKVSTG